MPFSLPHPSTIVDVTLATAGKAVSTAAALAATPGRVLRLIDSAEVLLARVTATVDAAERAVAEVQTVTATATLVAQEAERTSAIACTLVEQVGRTATATHDLVAAYEPAARRFLDQLSPEEVDAAIRLIDELPKLADHLNDDIMPILATLDRVGPDIHELLDVTRDVRQAILGIPGFARLRRRGEDLDERGDL
jgi:hypothetical protein